MAKQLTVNNNDYEEIVIIYTLKSDREGGV